MSSFNVHKKHALNEREPLEHRASHLRSCLNKVANLMGCTRNELVNNINTKTGVNVEAITNDDDLILALDYLLEIRDKKLNK